MGITAPEQQPGDIPCPSISRSAPPVSNAGSRAGLPLLEAKFRAHLMQRLPPQRQEATLAVSLDVQTLTTMPVHEYVDLHTL